MAEYTSVATQTVTANNNVIFTEVPVQGNSSVFHREGSGIVQLRGNTCQCRARFKVFFSGNIAVPTDGTVGPISLTIAIDGEPVQSSAMISTPAAVNEFNNVSSAVFIDVPKGCCFSVAVENTSTIAVDVANANLIVERVA